MVKKHGFKKSYLNKLFEDVEFQQRALGIFNPKYAKKPKKPKKIKKAEPKPIPKVGPKVIIKIKKVKNDNRKNQQCKFFD